MKQNVSERQKEALIKEFADSESIRTAQVMALLNIGPSRAREILAALVNEGILEASGAKKDRTYRLKSSA